MYVNNDLIGKSISEVLNNNADALGLLQPYLNQGCVLYFYPKDDTPGCTQQACELQTSFLNKFDEHHIHVVGVSKDDSQSHDQFSKKYNLTFPLISDTEGLLCEAFGVWVEKSMYGKKYFGIERSTFYIDEHQIIRQIWRNVKVPNHWDNIINILEL